MAFVFEDTETIPKKRFVFEDEKPSLFQKGKEGAVAGVRLLPKIGKQLGETAIGALGKTADLFGLDGTKVESVPSVIPQNLDDLQNQYAKEPEPSVPLGGPSPTPPQVTTPTPVGGQVLSKTGEVLTDIASKTGRTALGILGVRPTEPSVIPTPELFPSPRPSPLPGDEKTIQYEDMRPSHLPLERKETISARPEEPIDPYQIPGPEGTPLTIVPGVRTGKKLAKTDKAKASNILAISEASGLSPSAIEKNYDVITQNIGLRGTPTREELIGELFKWGIARGLGKAPGLTTRYILGYMGIKEAESVATQLIKGEIPKPFAGREAKEFLGPLGEPWSSAAELVEFALPAIFAGKVTKPFVNWYYGLTVKEKGLVRLSYDDLIARGHSEAELAKKSTRYWQEAFERRTKGEVAQEQKVSPAPEPTIPPAATPPAGTPPTLVQELTKIPAESEKVAPTPSGEGFQPPKLPNRERFEELEGFDKYRSELDKYHKDFDSWVKSIPENDPVIMQTDNMIHVITKDPKGGWRSTAISRSDKMPWGHEEYPTKLETLREHRFEERIEKIPFEVKPLTPRDKFGNLKPAEPPKPPVEPGITLKKAGKNQSEYVISEEGWTKLKNTPYATQLRQASTRETLGSRDQLKDLFYVGGSPRVIPKDAGFTTQEILDALSYKKTVEPGKVGVKKPEGTILTWLKDQGGINDKDYNEVFSSKESGLIGLVDKKRGKSMDVLATRAREYGWQGIEGPEDLYRVLTGEKKTILAGTEAIKTEKLVKEESKKPIRPEEQEGFVEVPAKEPLSAEDLKPGDKVLIRGEEYEHKGFDSEGKAIIEDGEKYRLEPWERVDADAIKKGEVDRQKEILEQIKKENPEEYAKILKGNTAELVKEWEAKRLGKAKKMTQEGLFEKPKTQLELGSKKPSAVAGVRKGILGEGGFIKIGKDPKPQFKGDASKVEGMFEKAEKASKEIHKTDLARIYHQIKRSTVDVSGNLRKTLLRMRERQRGRLNPAEEVVMRHELIAGANPKAIHLYNEAFKQTFRDLSELEQTYLNRVIQARRTIEIESYKPEVKHPEGLGTKELQDWLEQIPAELKTKLNERADLYFKEMRTQGIDQLLAEKIINQKQHDALAKHIYSPRQFLQHIDPERTYTIAGKKITVPDSGIKALEEGSYGLLENDGRLLLSQVITRTQTRIFRNRANKALYDLAKEIPDNGVVKLAKVIKTTEEGKPVYQPTPTGFDKIKVMIDGTPREMLMPSEMAMEWITRDPLLGETTASVIRWLSGAAILKPMATGLNPEFALTNVPRDILHVWLTDYRSTYSSNLPIFLGQMGKDLKAVTKDTLTRKGRVIDYIKEGGGMEFLTHQGWFKQKGLSQQSKDLQKILGYIGESSELMTRLALRERGINAGYTPEQATWLARNYLDFSQGGNFIKAVDTGVPYLNAAVQATRTAFRAAALNPALFTWKIAQLATVTTALFYLNRFTDPEAWENISSQEKAANFILPTPFRFIDKEGNKRAFYFRIPKDQTIRPILSAFEAIAAKVIGDEVDTDEIVHAVQEFSPVGPTQTLPPTFDAFLGYISNKDFWRNEDIWKGPKIKAEEEYTKYTHPLFIKAGKLTGLSPERLRHVLTQYFTSGNIYSSMGGYAWKIILDEMPEAERKMVTEELILKQPFIRRLARSTQPAYKLIKETEKKKMESNTERYKLTREFDVLSQRFYDKEVTKEKIENFLKEIPIEEKVRLKRRHFRLGRIQELPEKRWWLELAEALPEARALIYWNRWRTATEEEKSILEKNRLKVPGIMGGSFIKRLNELKGKSELPTKEPEPQPIPGVRR